MPVYNRKHCFGFRGIPPVLLKILCSVPGSLSFIENDNVFDRGFVGLIKSFTHEDMHVLNERTHHSVAASFSASTFMIASNGSRHDLHERSVTRKEDSSRAISFTQGRIVNDIQAGKRFARTGDAGNEGQYFFSPLLRLLNEMH